MSKVNENYKSLSNRKTKVSIDVPTIILNKIDSARKKEKITRSAWMVMAAMEKLNEDVT